jgi:galactose mutarotase-like enzyme
MPQLTITNEALAVAVDTHGAELASIRTRDGAEWLWQGDPKWWTGRAPILFPIVGRSLDDTVNIAGKPYKMGTHGFARHSEFAVVDSTPELLRLRIADSETTRAQYPFAFQLDLVFAVAGTTLSMRAEVTNTGALRLPFSFGFHPGFRWPLPGGEGKTHWLTLAEPEEPLTRRLGDRLMLGQGYEPSVFKAGRYAPQAADFANDAVIVDAARSRAVTFGVDGGPSLEASFPEFPAFGFWQKPGAPYLCIEPWQGLTPFVGGSMALEERPGILFLDAGDTNTLTMSVTFNPRA